MVHIHTNLTKKLKPFARALLTLGPIGFLPAPGTIASAITCLLIILAHPYNHQIEIAYGAFFICGYLAARIVHDSVRPDPSEYVLDEVVGMLITLSLGPRTPSIYLTGFLLFRFFDIVKPLAITTIQNRLKGPLGIFLDDIIAGIYALICLTLFKHVGLLP